MPNKIHFNKPQFKSLLIGAPNEVFIGGRGTGKTEGIYAEKTCNRYFRTMPRSLGAFVGATYNQLLTRTMPALIAGWERLGYKMGVHYLIGTKPSEQWKKMWNWKGPYRPPLDYKYFVSWFNGAGAHLISQDRTGSSNGLTLDWIGGDEARLLNEEKLKTETYPANRGINAAFINNPYHHGITLISDMPVNVSGRWLLDASINNDPQKNNNIIQYQIAISELKKTYNSAAKYLQKDILKQIEILEDEINILRKDLFYYHEASSLENIDALGINFIKQQIRDTTEFQFDTQILNIRPTKLENGFYPDLNDEYHGYFKENENYFDSVNFNYANPIFDCRKDSDLLTNEPLHISLDYNASIHPIVVAQVDNQKINIIKGIYSLFPNKLKDALKQFIEYYKYHNNKLIYYWYDHTAVGGLNDIEKCDEVIEILRAAGFDVVGMYVGQQPTHDTRYYMWGHLLKEDNKYNKIIRFNRENASDVLISMSLAPLENKKNGFGKDKKTEHDGKTPAQESTHFSDAIDTLVFGLLESDLTYLNTGFGTSIIL